MSPLSPVYEPRYYERAAERQVARFARGPLFINVPWGVGRSPSTLPELDGALYREGRLVPVEAKAQQPHPPRSGAFSRRDTPESINQSIRREYPRLIADCADEAPQWAYWVSQEELDCTSRG
jgi:hypothetical protein